MEKDTSTMNVCEIDNEGLEKAALEIARMETPSGAAYTSFPLYVTFKSGAKWMKKLMLKEAVEGEITKDNRGNNVLRVGVLNNGFEIGDKVRVIIVKED